MNFVEPLRQFKRLFNTHEKPPYDSELSELEFKLTGQQRFYVDLPRLEMFLIARHGDYSPKSMRDVIVENYGESALKLIESWL